MRGILTDSEVIGGSGRVVTYAGALSREPSPVDLIELTKAAVSRGVTVSRWSAPPRTVGNDSLRQVDVVERR